MPFASDAPANGKDVFRGLPCTKSAHALLARPAQTLAVLGKTSPGNWRHWIAKRAWGPTYHIIYDHLMSPFASEREMNEVRALMLEAERLRGAWWNPLASHAPCMSQWFKSIAALRASVLRARELPVLLGAVQKALARVDQDEPLLRKAYDEQEIMVYIYRMWVCASMPNAELESALDIADQIAAAIACEANAYASELAANSVSPAFFNLEHLSSSFMRYCTHTPVQIELQARQTITKLINKNYPLYTSFPYWPALHAQLVLVEFPVDCLAMYVRGGCVARMLVAEFVHQAEDMCRRTDGFCNCRARLDAVWAPIETALRALCPPDTAK